MRIYNFNVIIKPIIVKMKGAENLLNGSIRRVDYDRIKKSTNRMPADFKLFTLTLTYFFNAAFVKIYSGISWLNFISSTINSVPSPCFSMSL